MYSVYHSETALTKAHATDAAFDLVATQAAVIEPGEQPTVVRTGLHLGLQPGWVGLVCSRSGLASKGLIVANAPGVIDSGYRGEVKVILAAIGHEGHVVVPGDRIAQLIVTHLPTPFLARIGADEWERGLETTDRGVNGLGSTGLRAIPGGEAA